MQVRLPAFPMCTHVTRIAPTRRPQTLYVQARDHDSAVKRRCSQFATDTVENTLLLREKEQTFVRNAASSAFPEEKTPLQSREGTLRTRNIPAKFDTLDHEVIVTWAAKQSLRATKKLHVLPPQMPSRTKPSPFLQRSRLADTRATSRFDLPRGPTRSTRAPRRLPPRVFTANDPNHATPYISMRRQEARKAEIFVIDSANSTPHVRSRMASQEQSRESFLRRPRSTQAVPASDKSSPGVQRSLDDIKADTQSTSQEPFGEDFAIDAISPVVQQRSQSPHMEDSSDSVGNSQGVSVPNRSPSVAPGRVWGTGTLSSLLSQSGVSRVSSPAASFGIPGSTMTSCLDKNEVWAQTARELIEMNEPASLEKMHGESYTEANMSATHAMAHIAVDKRELIRRFVDFPTGTSIGLLGRDRPVTAQEKKEIRDESKRLLSTSHGISANCMDGLGGNKYLGRHHSFHGRCVPVRPHFRKVQETQYANVRLRSVISNHMDMVMFGGVEKAASQAHEKALGRSLVLLGSQDDTSPLALFPGILELLFGILEQSESHTACIDVAEGLAHIARHAHVQEALITGRYRRDETDQTFLGLLTELIGKTASTREHSKLLAQYAKLIACLCRSEAGFLACRAEGLVDILQNLSSECEDPAVVRSYQDVRSNERLFSAEYSISSFKGSQDILAEESNLSTSHPVSDCLAQPSIFSIGTGDSRGSPQTQFVDRRTWKPDPFRNPMALPVWERCTSSVPGINAQFWAARKKALRRPASPRHRE